MNVSTLAGPYDAPAHVPPELVFEIALESLPGVERDSIKATVDALRELPDIFYSVSPGRREGSGWMVGRHALMREVLQDDEHFTSERATGFSSLVGENWPLIPLELGGEAHTSWRKIINPLFSPAKIKSMEAGIDDLAVNLIEGFKDKGECEFMSEFANVFPVQIFLNIFGLPIEKSLEFIGWADDLVRGLTQEENERGARAIIGYLRQVIADRKKNPQPDLITFVTQVEVDGRKATDDEMLGVCMLFFLGGLDTVASSLSYVFWHLARNPEDQQTLRDNPEMIPNALEELLRAYPVVTTSRTLTMDHEFHGIKMKKGERVTLPLMCAGRDDREFMDPDHIDFTRDNAVHISFAAGPHRCIGSHLARRELRIAIEEWLKRIPPFRLNPDDEPIAHGVIVFGMKKLPLVW